MKTPCLPWTKLREEMLDLKYGQHKKLWEINAYLFEKYGKHVTNARLSQLFSGWDKEQEVKPPVVMEENSAN